MMSTEIGANDFRLLMAIKANLPDLKALRDRARSHWEYEDSIYRFYHGSFKVYGIQRLTLQIVSALRALLPDRSLNERFMRIVSDGTGREFTPEVNASWEATTRPLLEAFFHAQYFLEMVVKYGEELDEPPSPLPSGWAAVLYLYNMR
jgi:hypothetical protein